jgi:hypothetical protein
MILPYIKNAKINNKSKEVSKIMILSPSSLLKLPKALFEESVDVSK